MSGEVVKIKRKTLADLMTCPLCNKLFTKATSITECLHTFCRKCIYKKLQDEEMDHCPVCKTNLGASPVDKLRPDHLKESLRSTIFGSKPNKAQPVAVQAAPLAERQDSNPDPELVQPSTGLVEMANQPITKESNAVTSSGSVNKEGNIGENRAQGHVGSSSASDARSKPIWFYLIAAQNVESPLPQIPRPYISIKDGRLQVSTLNKYVAQKLGLANDAEVEISLGGYPMDSMAQLKDLLEWWLNNSPEHSQRIQTRVGSSGKDFVMPLTYARKSG